MFKKILSSIPSIVHHAMHTPYLSVIATLLAVADDYTGLWVAVPLCLLNCLAPATLPLARHRYLPLSKFYHWTIAYISITMLILLAAYAILPTLYFIPFGLIALISLFLNFNVFEEAQKVAIEAYIQKTIEREQALRESSEPILNYKMAEERNRELDALENK